MSAAKDPAANPASAESASPISGPEDPSGLPPRFAIGADQIAAVVAAFYAAIRRHGELGPIFARHVQDWPAHEAKITAFWRNAILYDRSYQGSPMRAHLQAGDVRAAHFPSWLGLFDATLAAEARRGTLAEDSARAWSALAHRIGQGLRMGVAELETRGGAPILR